MINVYIGLGSNLDNPLDQVLQAIKELANLGQSRFIACSRIYKSHPMQTPNEIEQPDFVNAVVALETTLDATGLLYGLREIENKHQRHRDEQRWGPRTLDLDILLYGDQILNTSVLTIPHAGISERDFVLFPLQDIAPDLNIPGKGPISELVKQCISHHLEVVVEEIEKMSLNS